MPLLLLVLLVLLMLLSKVKLIWIQMGMIDPRTLMTDLGIQNNGLAVGAVFPCLPCFLADSLNFRQISSLKIAGEIAEEVAVGTGVHIVLRCLVVPWFIHRGGRLVGVGSNMGENWREKSETDVETESTGDSGCSG